MEPVPNWFKRELRTVDPNYYVVINEESQVYRIMMNSDVVVQSPFRGAYRIIGPKTVDVFRYLNDEALTKLRYRKWLGRQMKIIENPNAEWNFLQAQEKAAKAKEMDLVYDMMAEGGMEAYKIDRKHTVS
jgi:hypothetical protein